MTDFNEFLSNTQTVLRESRDTLNRKACGWRSAEIDFSEHKRASKNYSDSVAKLELSGHVKNGSLAIHISETYEVKNGLRSNNIHIDLSPENVVALREYLDTIAKEV